MVRGPRPSVVPIILATHFIEEAEEMADRIGMMNHGEIILVEGASEVLGRHKLGKKQLHLQLHEPSSRGIPPALAKRHRRSRRMVWSSSIPR